LGAKPNTFGLFLASLCGSQFHKDNNPPTLSTIQKKRPS
jgi:hypothetical protein